MKTFLKTGRTYSNADFVRRVTVNEDGDRADIAYDGESSTPVIGKEAVDELVEQLECEVPGLLPVTTIEAQIEPDGIPTEPAAANETPPCPTFESLGIEARPSKLLREAGIQTVDELVTFAGANDLKVIDGIGPSTARDIRAALGDRLPAAAAADESGGEDDTPADGDE